MTGGHRMTRAVSFSTWCNNKIALGIELTSDVDVVDNSEIPATWTFPEASSLRSRYPDAGFRRSRIISL